MKILFLTYDLPYPLNAGGKIRAYYLLKSLAKENELTLFSYYRNEAQKHSLVSLKPYCNKIVLFKRRPAWSWQNIIRSLFTSLPFTASTYYSSEIKEALIKELKQNSYDLVHFESFYPALFLPLVKKLGVKTIMGNENIEYRIYQRYVNSKKFFLLRWILNLEILKMRLFEERLWRMADLNLSLSLADSQPVKKITHRSPLIVPNGVDLSVFKKKPKIGKQLIFIGNLAYQANNDAIRFFLEEVYPLIKKKVVSVGFTLISASKPQWLEKYLRDSSIKFIQDKKTPGYKLLNRGSILVAPIRIASGTNIKVLEAMALGLAVVTTSVGIEGIRAKNEQEVIIADQAEDFSQAVIQLIQSPKKCQRLGSAARKLIEKEYDWAKIGEELAKAYQKL